MIVSVYCCFKLVFFVDSHVCKVLIRLYGQWTPLRLRAEIRKKKKVEACKKQASEMNSKADTFA